MCRHIVLFLLLSLNLAACATTSLLRDKHDGFFIRNAALADEHYLAGLESLPAGDRASDWSAMGVFAHRVAAGQGAVLAYRAYSPGGLMVMDDESFEKVTVWFKHGMPAVGTTRIDGDTVVVVRTRGGSAWPRSACSGVLTEGTIDLAKRRNGFRATIQGALAQRGNRNPAECMRDRLDVSFEVSEIGLAELTPWLGNKGGHPYDESYGR
jgi:hypothetical protein